MIKKMKLKIQGMHCTSCAMNIDGELEDLGIKNVSTNYIKSETDIEFDEGKISFEEIRNAIEKLGYKVV